MSTPRTRPRRALVASAVALLLLSGCRLPFIGGDGQSPAAPTTQAAPSSSDAGGASEGASPSASKPPSDDGGRAAPATPGERCGEAGGWAIVVAQGTADCTAALAVVADYEDTPDIAPGGRPANPEEIQGWACEPIIFAKMGFEPDTYSTWCQKGEDAIMTIDARTDLPAGTIRKPTEAILEGTSPKMVQWGFTTPSGSWYCGLFDDPSNREYPSGAECYSLGDAIPGQVAEGPDGPETPATMVAMSETGAIESFFSGDLALHYVLEQHPITLGYGEVLYARGGACSVDQQAGVTCTLPGHGFTVSLSAGLTSH